MRLTIADLFEGSSFYDAYQLYSRGAAYILEEGYKRAQENGVGIIDPLPLGDYVRSLPLVSYAAQLVPRFYVFSGTKSNLQNVASYGEVVSDPRAREPHSRVQQATGTETIVNQVGKKAADEKIKIAKNLAGIQGANFNVVFAYAKDLAKNISTHWQDDESFQNNMTYVGAKIIGKCFLGIDHLPREYVKLLRQANDLISGEKADPDQLAQMSEKIIQMSDALLDKNAQEVIAANRYANTQYPLNGDETEEEIKTKLINSHAGAGFIVESNLSFLLMVAIAYISESPEIYEQMMQEINRMPTETLDDTKQLTYMKCIYRETLRIASGTAVVPRVTSVYSEMEVENSEQEKHNCSIYPNSYLFFPVRMIHHNKALWPNPQAFDPTRFSRQIKSNTSGFIDKDFFAFSAGKRGCPAGTGFVEYAFIGFLTEFYKANKLQLDRPIETIPATAIHPRWKEEYYATIETLDRSIIKYG